MIDAAGTFLIDGTGFFEASHKAFLGVTVLVVDGEDWTFLFGVVRDLLQLRQTLGITKGLFVIGAEAYQVTSASNIQKTASFLEQIGITVVHDPRSRALDLCVRFASLTTFVVTHNRALLLLAKDGRRILLLKDAGRCEFFESETLLSRFGVTTDSVPVFLALTDGPKDTVLTNREAIAVLEPPGDLADKILDSSVLSSRQLRNKLMKNGAVILSRLKQFSPTGCCASLDVDQGNLAIDIDNNLTATCLAKRGFHSLIRLLPQPPTITTVFTEERKQRPFDYHAIVTLEDLQRLARVVGVSTCCAVDTESSNKDPHTAELFGMSISVKKGEAFYVPLIAQDLNGIDRNTVVSVLCGLLEGPIKVTGHNLKYDYVLLRRNGIKIANIDFDTMLAAYDCFGDLDVLNLQYLAKLLLGRTIKSHRDIVSAKRSLLDVPFRDLADYACDHAEVTLQLADILQQELTRRGISDQYRDETLPMVKILGDFEVDGIPVDLRVLCSIRDSLADQVLRAKKAALDEADCHFNLDSEKEVMAVLMRNQVIAKTVGFRKISSRVLEELAIAHKVARLVVTYKRGQKKLRGIEGVIESIRNGRVHPVFNQTRTDHCRLSSVKPILFEVDTGQQRGSFLPDELRQFYPDANRALGILADAAADHALREDILSPLATSSLQSSPPLLQEEYFRLLISVVVGIPEHQLGRMFLLDHDAISAICHHFKIRYSLTFLWLEQFCQQTVTNGFASAPGRRRYFDGLRSSNLEKREKALRSAVKWSIRW